MKNMKRIFSLVLALVMMMALTVSVAGAAGTNTITIENAEKGAHYTLYKIFGAKVIEGGVKNKEGITYYYCNGETEMPTQLDGVFQENTTLKTIEKKGTPTDQAIMDAVKTYAEATPAAKVKGPVENTAGGPVVFEGLEDGYYAVISDVSNGTAVTITSIAPNATVSEKNTSEVDPDPKNSVKKLVDASGNVLEDKSVFVGETVHFMISTTAVNWVDSDNDPKNGAERKITYYTVVDEGADFLDGLKLDSITIKDSKGNVLKTFTEADFGEEAKTYTIPWIEVPTGKTIDTMTQEEKDAANHLYPSGSKIEAMYSATVNKAVISDKPAVNYGYISPSGYTKPEKPETPNEEVKSYGFGLMKIKADGTLLDNAKFTLWTGENAATEVKVILDTEKGCYRPVVEGETAEQIVAGNVEIKGLENGTYYLKEVEAPKGYNAIPGIANEDGLVIKDDNNFVTAKTEGDVTTYVSGGVKVVNNSGTELPATGGIGTTIFTVTGGLLMIGAAILFLTKKRSEG